MHVSFKKMLGWKDPNAHTRCGQANTASDRGRSHRDMALARALAAVRSGVISHIQVPVGGFQAAAGGLSLTLSRGFAEGTYLNKDDVTERVLKVVKNFEKTDPAKVWSMLACLWQQSVVIRSVVNQVTGRL